MAKQGGAMDWPLFGNARDNTRYSPSGAINPATVARLRLAWRRDEGFGQVTWESFPLVLDGRMYLTTNTDEVWSLDGATGRVHWIYAPPVDFLSSLSVQGSDIPTNRGVAVAGGRVYLLTYDCRLLALDAHNGTLLWQAPVADPRLGYYETTAPAVWDGLVFIGGSGGDSGARGFEAAYDARTGARVWRRWTVPAPGQGWVPRQGHHGGGAVWMPPTVDARTGILYLATGNPSPSFVGSVRPGPDPFTDGILALRARDGAVLWFAPLSPHDEWDYDAASPVVIFDAHVHGRSVRAVGEASKSGYYSILDARTGRRLFAPTPFVRRIGQRRIRAGALVCPGDLGGSEYSPVAFSPLTRAVYVSGIDDCMVVKRDSAARVATHHAGQDDAGGVLLPGPDRPSGTFTAIAVDSGRVLWQRILPGPMIGGATATAGNLVFAGCSNGILYAFDASSGRIVWQDSMSTAFGSAPIVYTVGGRAYLAVVSGGAAVTAQYRLGRIGGSLYVLTPRGS